ncbi:SEC14-like protein 2 [Daphnia pulicaria]|uniref:SEC14-like protein 2 n=1 Tax=Daphnia pulicaria TaxID=35523 RepID=UPI001EE9C3B8|nr:SEC14-like protein 2 [Daphnia pulicaria]XP_046633902.1 SEC14-like protein 2 [Daphnia pulicaria]XP_046633903.1 SEC14-like protein 2 [Daphnia pulicaria]
MADSIKPLTDEQRAILNEFREKVGDCQLVDSSDAFLIKWLVARNYKVDQAEKMLRQSLEWRRLNRVNEILQTWTPPEVIEKYYSIGQTGYDKFGCPLWMSAQGPIDIRGIMQSTTKKELMRFMIYIMEKNALNMRQNPERCSSPSICVVADMEQLSMWQMAYRPVSQIRNEMVSIYEANYPENLRRIFIINAPKLFTVIYNMMRPFMNQVTIDKICVYGFDKDEWQSALLKDIEADQLPAHYGGTMTDPATGDPKCPHKLNMGGEVPHSYYVSNSKPVPKEGMQSLEIGSGSRKNLEFEIGATNSVLRWEFMTEGGDIGFRIYHVNGSKEDIVEVVPVSRIESHLVMEEGEIICDYIGKYVVEFENSFSFFKSKKVYYNVELAVK